MDAAPVDARLRGNVSDAPALVSQPSNLFREVLSVHLQASITTGVSLHSETEGDRLRRDISE